MADDGKAEVMGELFGEPGCPPEQRNRWRCAAPDCGMSGGPTLDSYAAWQQLEAHHAALHPRPPATVAPARLNNDPRAARALTLWRPWSELVLRHGKNIENRTWPAPQHLIGGLLIIHAGRGWDDTAAGTAMHALGALPKQWAELERQHGRGVRGWCPSGYVGVVRLLGVCRQGAGCGCGSWAASGQAHWQLGDPRLFPQPIPGTGRQGLWAPPPEVLEAVSAVHPHLEVVRG